MMVGNNIVQNFMPFPLSKILSKPFPIKSIPLMMANMGQDAPSTIMVISSVIKVAPLPMPT